MLPARFGRSEDVASSVLHLAWPEPAPIVGSQIVVDGGVSQP